MNILPHKSWHVRTKKNIDRVRRDEAKAAAEEKETQRRVQLAAQEARTSFLRERAKTRHLDSFDKSSSQEESSKNFELTQASDGHVNFFQDLEQGNRDSLVQNNAENEAEKKEEKEAHEKKIGLLVYLGQDNQQNSKDKPWYQSLHRNLGGGAPEADVQATAPEKDAKSLELRESRRKELQDPLGNIRKYLNTSGIKAVQQTSKPKLPESSKQVPKTEIKSKKHKHHKSRKFSKSKGSDSRKSKKRKHKHKSKEPSESSESSDDDDYEAEKRRKLESLRSERLQREREEKRRAEKLLATLRGEEVPENSTAPLDSETKSNKTREIHRESTSSASTVKMKQKYNSQFNPQLARQNYD